MTHADALNFLLLFRREVERIAQKHIPVPVIAGVGIHDRCNRWILYSALSQGLRRAFFVTLWNGEPGDGPGGTQNMIELVRKLTGRQPIIIDPATL